MCSSSAATIDAMKTTQWVLANNNVTGYYRVNYDQGNWERLLTTLSNSHTVRPGPGPSPGPGPQGPRQTSG